MTEPTTVVVPQGQEANHAERARMMLTEAGRPDLAAFVELNRAGHACRRGPLPSTEEDARLTFRAFKLSHIDALCPSIGNEGHGIYGNEVEFIEEGREAGWIR